MNRKGAKTQRKGKAECPQSVSYAGSSLRLRAFAVGFLQVIAIWNKGRS
jgi:hypothetical protein